MTAEGDQSKLAWPIEPLNGSEPNISTVPILNTTSCPSSTSPDPKISPVGSLRTSSSSLSTPKKLRKPVGHLKGYVFS